MFPVHAPSIPDGALEVSGSRNLLKNWIMSPTTPPVHHPLETWFDVVVDEPELSYQGSVGNLSWKPPYFPLTYLGIYSKWVSIIVM